MLKTLFLLSSVIFCTAVYAQGLNNNSDTIEKVVLEVLDESQGSDNLSDRNISDDNNTLVIPK